MWKSFVPLLCCPMCKAALELVPFAQASVDIDAPYERLAKQRGIYNADFNQSIESGLLLCHDGRHWFPIVSGVPILLPYQTPVHELFVSRFGNEMARLPFHYEFASGRPVSGEEFVMKSFSQEWLDYSYDGVMWGMNYEDHEKRFLYEVGAGCRPKDNGLFIEIGCGLGLTSYCAQKNFGVQAIGVDLSLAVLKAAEYYKTNPFLHFVQASAFKLPFREGIADVVYTHGVLHHTYSTSKAFQAVAPLCKPGGLLYVWVYGIESTRGSPLRRIAYLLEEKTRPVFATHDSLPVAKTFIRLLAVGYMGVNAYHRFRNPRMQRYNFQRALHAARDRFTPLYAHRHDHEEVAQWFREAGFDQIQKVDWQIMPLADRDNYRRNVGVRARRRHTPEP
ncbi:MAG TPA: methyltransferase domain-containing protein [Chthoniobacterales bacterium]